MFDPAGSLVLWVGSMLVDRNVDCTELYFSDLMDSSGIVGGDPSVFITLFARREVLRSDRVPLLRGESDGTLQVI